VEEFRVYNRHRHPPRLVATPARPHRCRSSMVTFELVRANVF